MTIVRVTARGERHGLINSVGNSCPNTGFVHMEPGIKAKAQALRKEEARIVKARYINSRGMHERLTKAYMRWEGDPIQTYNLIPGEVYDLPLGLVNEVNNSPGLARRSEVLDANGIPTLHDGSPEKLHQLVPVSF